MKKAIVAGVLGLTALSAQADNLPSNYGETVGCNQQDLLGCHIKNSDWQEWAGNPNTRTEKDCNEKRGWYLGLQCVYAVAEIKKYESRSNFVSSDDIQNSNNQNLLKKITLSCTYNLSDKGTKTSILEFNPLTLEGSLDNRKAYLKDFGNIYTVDTHKFGFELNRQTLAIEGGISLRDSAFSGDNITHGQCEKIQSKNQI